MINKQPPIGVKIISDLGYIETALTALLAIAAIFASQFASYLLPIPSIIKSAFPFIGILLLAFAVLSFFIARGLWKGKNWTRILTIIFAILGILSTIVSLFSGRFSSIIQLAIYGWIAYYLIANKEVKAFFG